MSSEDAQKVYKASEGILNQPESDGGEFSQSVEQFKTCMTRARQILGDHVTSKIPVPIASADGTFNEVTLLAAWHEFTANLGTYRQELDLQLALALDHGEKFARLTEGFGTVLNEFAQEGENLIEERWHSLYQWLVMKEMIIQGSSVQRARKQLLIHSNACTDANIADELHLLAGTHSEWWLDDTKDLLIGILKHPQNYSDPSGICDVLSGVAAVFELSAEFRRRSSWFLYETYEGTDKSDLLQAFEDQYGPYHPSGITSFSDYSEQLYAEHFQLAGNCSHYNPAQLWTELPESQLTQSNSLGDIKFELPGAGSLATSVPPILSMPPVISSVSNEVVETPNFRSNATVSTEEYQSEKGTLLVSGVALCLLGLLLWRVLGCFIPQAFVIAGIVQFIRWHFKKS